MQKQVEFLYDFGSPTSYLAWTQLPALCARYQARLVYRPVLLGGIFKATGNTTPVSIEPKGKWMFDDLARYAQHYGVPFARNPHFIFNSLAAMRGAIWARRNGRLEDYNRAVFAAAWEHGRDLGDTATLLEIAAAAELEPGALATALQQREIKQELIDETQDAVARGVFGAPTMFVDGEMHFGQDRLLWIERALARAGASETPP